MKITIELLKKFKTCCLDGFNTGVALGLDGLDSTEIISILDANGHKTYADWIRLFEKNPLAWMYTKEYEYIKYLVFNPIDRKFYASKTLEESIALKQSLINENPTIQEDLFLMRAEIKSLKGDVIIFDYSEYYANN